MVAPQRGRRDRSRRDKKHGTERPRTRLGTSSGDSLPNTDPVDFSGDLEATPARPRGDIEGTASLAAQRSGLGDDEPARLERGRSDALKRDARPRGTNTSAAPARPATKAIRRWPTSEQRAARFARRPRPLGRPYGPRPAQKTSIATSLAASVSPTTAVQLRQDGRASGRPPSAAMVCWAGRTTTALTRLGPRKPPVASTTFIASTTQPPPQLGNETSALIRAHLLR